MLTVYIDEAAGSDEIGKGTQKLPYKSFAFAVHSSGGPDNAKYLIRKDTTADYNEATQSALEKVTKGVDDIEKERGKTAKLASSEGGERKSERGREEQLLEESKRIILEEDPALPKATRTKIGNATSHRGKRIRVYGWVHRLSSQKGIIFIVLRDGTGYLQSVLSGRVAQTYDALTLTIESSLELVGTLKEVSEGKTAPGGHELVVDYWKVLGAAPGVDDVFTNRLNEKADPAILADLRHLVIRGETASTVLRLRAHLLTAFRESLISHDIIEVTPPCLVQIKVEGEATPFKLDYYGQQAFLTQSSQLHLETCLPSLGDVFCVQESFRAEKRHTRRHLTEYTHLEVELAFITFEDLMTHIETIICETVDRILAQPGPAALLNYLNPDFKPPARPFRRMSYSAAITWLNEHGIKHEKEDADGNAVKDEAGNPIMVEHAVGDDIAEAAERQMMDLIGAPIFLYGFPAKLKDFYMKKMPADKQEGDHIFTESCDLLMPGVGEVVGGSMRIPDEEELLAVYKREGIDPGPCYWFTDQRKYGTCEHGGYGLGVERFLAWFANRYTVRECSLYPRWPGRANP